MASIPQPSLFNWQQIEAGSDLDRLSLVLSVMPDEQFVRVLEKHRGRGRDDYPIRPCWNALIAGIVFQHESAAGLLRELRRNAELRQLCGFDPLLGGDAVPTDDAFGRFLNLVMRYRKHLVKIFHTLIGELKKALPDLGAKLSVDSKGIRSHGRPVRHEENRKEPDRRRDTDADWGTKTYKGTRSDGTAWNKVVRWFGYKLHLLVDSVYELPLAFKLTVASAGDSPELLKLLDNLKNHHSEIVEDSEEVAADKGYDSYENNRQLYDGYGIKPIIDIRSTWQDSEVTRPVFGDRCDSFVYDETGSVYCICPATGEQRKLSFCGFERDRRTLKYRCPAAAYGLRCRGREECESNAKVGGFGRIIRVPIEKNRRTFTPIARQTYKWNTAYDRRTAVERVNSRLDNVLGFEKHYIRGHAKMEMRVTLALIVMLAMALGRIRLNQANLMRSLTAPVRRAA
jgi:hypothetical protein